MICSTSHFHLRNISRIRPFLSAESTERLVHAFITSKLDIGNSLLYGLPDTQLNRLQRLQNHAARLITKTPVHMHITPVLKALHWLPVRRRIEFKLLLQVYRALSDQGPMYISDLLILNVPSRALRSASQQQLVVPRTFTAYGDRAFSSAATKLWNNLPLWIRCSESIQIFKRRLKTHLFNCAFVNVKPFLSFNCTELLYTYVVYILWERSSF